MTGEEREQATLAGALTAGGPIRSAPKDRLAGKSHERSRSAFILFVLGLLLVDGRALASLVVYAARNEMDSYILLIPFVSGWLIYLRKRQLPPADRTSPLAIPFLLLAIASFVAARRFAGFLSWNDYLSINAFSFVTAMIAGAALCFGTKWLRAALFPAGFLLFFVPLPDACVRVLEGASQNASADVASWFFGLADLPVLRDGTVFQLPDIAIRVAQECSGIHSSIVLFITGVLASNLLLASNWRRLALALFVIPLGIVRNGFRIFVLGWLCTRFGPQMIDSPIHHHGGPLFFVLSLAPLYLFLRLLLTRPSPLVTEANSVR